MTPTFVSRWLGILVLIFPALAACDVDPAADNEDAEAEEQESVEPGEDASVTFSRGTETEASGMADRLPAEPGQTIMIPSTELIPGEVAAVPNITNPLSGDAEAISAGERHFAAFNCAGCHAPLGGGGMGPPLSDEKWIYGSAPAQIYLSIMHGRPDGMPAWSSMLPERAVWELVAYIETLDEIENYAEELDFEQDPGFEDEGEDEEQDDDEAVNDTP